MVLRIFSLAWINKENLAFAYGGKRELNYVQFTCMTVPCLIKVNFDYAVSQGKFVNAHYFLKTRRAMLRSKKCFHSILKNQWWLQTNFGFSESSGTQWMGVQQVCYKRIAFALVLHNVHCSVNWAAPAVVPKEGLMSFLRYS